MSMNAIGRVLVTLVLVCPLPLCGAHAEEAERQPALVTGNSLELSDGPSGEADWENRWYAFWGAANIHARLEESEASVDRKINHTLGLLLPGWKKPKTFKDWSEDFKIYDGHLGVGRDLGRKWSWFVSGGGATGEIYNRDRYGLLGLPFQSRVEFKRTAWFVSTGVDFFPWGKPCLEEGRGAGRLARSLKAARPYAELAVGFVHADGYAKVKLSVLGSGGNLTFIEHLDHRVHYVSPRLGVEIPIDHNDAIAVQAGYLFFDQHSSDLDNLSIYLLHRHRF